MIGRLAGIFLLFGAMVFALGIGADFASYDADRSVHIAVVADDQELIDLEPNQPYAYIDENDGKLYIDISTNNPNYPVGGGIGISPDAKYSFDCMFNVSNHLWEDVTINVTITSDNDLVKLYLTQPDVADSSINFLILPGEEVCVGMSFDGDGKGPGDTIEGQLTIHAEPVSQ